jgi:putative tryptophan/tyrosine transport system substrate-binding protein
MKQMDKTGGLLQSLRRRDLIAMLGGVAMPWPNGARAQQRERMRRVGMLIGVPLDDPINRQIEDPLIDELKHLGWTQGENYRIDIRSANGGGAAGFHAGAAELVALAPDVIIGVTPGAATALKVVSPDIPILFVIMDDPIGRGLVASIARPGGNITGLTDVDPRIGGKWVQLLKQMVPNIERIAIAHNPDASGTFGGMRASIERAAASMAVQIVDAQFHGESDIDAAIDILGRHPNTALISGVDAFAATHRAPIIAAAARNRLPAIYSVRYWATDGGLMSYGVDQMDMFRQLALYVDRTLRGAHPADLPVMSPRKFQLVINLKTAKALRLTVPSLLLTGADEVVE